MSGGDANGRPSGCAVAEARVRSALEGSKFADVRWVAETGSTNADAMALARHGEPEGVVLVADHQTAGRGRRGRMWDAPPGASLLFSVLLRPPSPVAGVVTMALGVAVVEALAALGVTSARLKWPNDVVVPAHGDQPDRKLAGILAEADWPAGAGIADGWRPPGPKERVTVVVGVGLNVNWPPLDSAGFPVELADTAVAVNHLVGAAGRADVGRPDVDRADVDRAGLLVGILQGLEARYGELVGAGPEPLVAAWSARSATLGQRVRVDLGVDDLVGTAVDVTAEGLLVIETIDGGRRTIAVGDVVHLRPAE